LNLLLDLENPKGYYFLAKLIEDKGINYFNVNDQKKQILMGYELAA
jgi:hypothetical protein